MAPDIASRIRAKLLKRRHSSSAAPSFVSTHSAASSVNSTGNLPSSGLSQSQCLGQGSATPGSSRNSSPRQKRSKKESEHQHQHQHQQHHHHHHNLLGIITGSHREHSLLSTATTTTSTSPGHPPQSSLGASSTSSGDGVVEDSTILMPDPTKSSQPSSSPRPEAEGDGHSDGDGQHQRQHQHQHPQAKHQAPVVVVGAGAAKDGHDHNQDLASGASDGGAHASSSASPSATTTTTTSNAAAAAAAADGGDRDPPSSQTGDRHPAALQSRQPRSHSPPAPLHSAQPLSPSAPQAPARLHSIDESASPTSTTPGARIGPDNAAAASADDTTTTDDSDAVSFRDKKPGPLELNLISNHHLTAAAAATQQHSAVNTPASYYFHPQAPPRRQSLLSHRHSSLIKSLLNGPATNDAEETASIIAPTDLDVAEMVTTRKIWVKRPHASPTLITINEEDLVDDVRDLILRKYANSLGRNFDSPDLTLRICPREQSQKERLLGPEEPMCRVLDAYFSGGQTVDEALVIDIPRRTPKPSPRPTTLYVTDDGRPSETGEGYFPPVGGVPSPHHQVAVPAPTNGTVTHSIAVLGTGHIPPIPSPGGTRSRAYRERTDRPRLGRTHTSSPNVIANGAQNPVAAAAVAEGTVSHSMQHYNRRPSHSRAHSNSSDHKGLAQATAPPLPTSPGAQKSQARVGTPPPRVSSPRPSASRLKKSKKPSEYLSLSLSGSQGILSGGVPPISVLIVEDNPINLKLLEAFVKRLKVRWQTAMNGRDAVKKWRSGGFHLVLMDIQLPVMNGLDATREIRRLERVNSIGVFSSSPTSLPGSLPEEANTGELDDGDRLENISLFKSPVIIVALTASSLQSDRHEALAAGCNDFLTKPVNFVWLERKVMEWGCMQALIDFDGWRKWKDFSQEAQANETSKKSSTAKGKKKKSSLSSTG